MEKTTVGIVGVGTYLPSKKMTAKEISEKTNGVWSEEAIINKLGIVEKFIPGEDDGTQEMGVRAALNCLKNSNIDPKDIDVILCIGEEWKEYPLTTSALYIQDRIGAVNAWGIDVQNRCCTCVSAMQIARDMLIAEDNIEDEGKYQNGGTHYQLVSYDPNITNYSSEESITSYYDIEVYIGYYRTGSYYTDWFYTYDIPTIHRIVIEEVAEVIIPAHKEVRTYQFGKLIKDID